MAEVVLTPLGNGMEPRIRHRPVPALQQTTPCGRPNPERNINSLEAPRRGRYQVLLFELRPVGYERQKVGV